MSTKFVFGLVGIVLVLGFLGPIIVKLKSIALGIVMLCGVAMMIYDFVESLRERDDS